MKIENGNNVKMCGNPYAVCIAETPEEAQRLYEFMQSMDSNSLTPESKTHKWSIEDSYGDYGEYNIHTYKDAQERAINWCNAYGKEGYYVKILDNGKEIKRVTCTLTFE